jgi:diacylglycerol kinase (ATP)
MKHRAGNSKALFIINPYAGILPVNLIISKELNRRRHELSCYKSLSIDESGNLIRQNFDKYDFFIAAGGDGTVRTVASRLIGTDKVLGVLPMGSGNGFAKELGFQTNIRSLLKDIEKNESTCIDVLEVNNNLCLNVAGVGLDSFVTHSFDRLKTRGFWSYVWVTALNFFRLRPIHVTIKTEDGEIISDDFFDVTVANTRQFGNYAFIAPEADPNDGKMDIAMIRPFPKIMAPVMIYRLYTKNLNKSKYVKHLQTDSNITIITSETRFQIDGEPVTLTGDVVISIKKNALRVLRTKRLRSRKSQHSDI